MSRLVFKAAFFPLLLWFLDFPKPYVDDLFYAGAALNLAAGGDLSNPLLVRQHFPGHLFFIYPPIHSYALAFWLKIFGISALAMTGFQIMAYLVIALATLAWLRTLNFPRRAEWLVPLAVICAFVNFGFRPEPLAVALMMTGLCLAYVHGRHRGFAAFGYFLLSLGIATSPRTAYFGVALLGMAFHQNTKSAGKSARIKSGVCLGLGIIAAALLFCLMVDFRLGEFWHAFRFHAQSYLGDSKLLLLNWFFTRYLGITQWPVILVFVALLALSLRAPLTPAKSLGWLIAATLPFVALTAGLGIGVLWFISLGVIALSASCEPTFKQRNAKTALGAIVMGVLILANLKTVVEVAGLISGNIKLTPPANRGEILARQSTPEHPMLVDECVARYVYDYRLPKGFIYWDFSGGFPPDLAIDAKLLPNDIYLLGPINVAKLNERHLTQIPQPMWGLRKRNWSFYREPEKAYVIPVAGLISAP